MIYLIVVKMVLKYKTNIIIKKFFAFFKGISHEEKPLHTIKYIGKERSFILIKDPYIGMPIIIDDSWNKPGQDCCGGGADNSGSIGDAEMDQMGGSFDEMYLGSLPLAMCYVPFQRWKTTYPNDKALDRGTIFPELDLPFEGGMRR